MEKLQSAGLHEICITHTLELHLILQETVKMLSEVYIYIIQHINMGTARAPLF